MKKKKPPEPKTEIRWRYAKDSLCRQLVDLECRLNDLQSNIHALTYLYNHSVFDDTQLKTKKKKKKNK